MSNRPRTRANEIKGDFAQRHARYRLTIPLKPVERVTINTEGQLVEG